MRIEIPEHYRVIVLEDQVNELEEEVTTLRKITQDLRMDIATLKCRKKNKETDTFEAEIKSLNNIRDLTHQTMELQKQINWFSNEEVKEKKRKAAKYTRLKPCACGLYPEIYCDCEKRDNGDLWVYEIYCANEDCDCYLTSTKMLKTDEDPFEFEEEARKDWNKMVEGKE